MKIKMAASDPLSRRCLIELVDVQEDVISLQGKNDHSVLVLFESSDGAASPTVIAKLRQMADDLERGLKADMTPPTAQPKARA